MVEMRVPVLTCPFCVTGESVVTVDLWRVRRVSYAGVVLDDNRPGHPAVAFSEATAGPCPHLVDLTVWADWARLARRDGGPVGTLQARWWHPATIGIGADRIERLRSAGEPGRSRRRRPATPVRAAEDERAGVVEGQPATRTWRWTVIGRAVFSEDPVRLADELRASEPRRPPRGSPLTGEDGWP